MADLLVYGSYGYTGRLVVEEAVERGLDVVVAGRDRGAVENQAIRQGCEERVFSLDERQVLDMALEDVPVVLNCAGPFADTYRPLVEGCLRTGTHYLDITGEIEVFEAIASEDDRASEAGVMLLPGVGFDVVPTDCLAAHLRDRLVADDADTDLGSLSLGFQALGTVSPGTARTTIRGLGSGGAVRRGGTIESVPAAWRTRRIDFGDGERTAATVPWGDVSTAYHTTGVPDVDVYMAMPSRSVRFLRASSRLGFLLGSRPVQALLERLVDSRVDGPDADERASGRTYVWGELTATDGRRVVSRLVCPEGYRLTRLSAVEIARRVIDGDAPPGFQTPAGAYGADLILDIGESERSDEPIEDADGVPAETVAGADEA